MAWSTSARFPRQTVRSSPPRDPLAPGKLREPTLKPHAQPIVNELLGGGRRESTGENGSRAAERACLCLGGAAASPDGARAV